MLYEWLRRHWVAAALCMGILLLLLSPLLALTWSPALLLIFLQTPIYMLHQVEEHVDDRFRRFVNQRLFHGAEVFSTASILWINIPGVWGVTLLSLYAASLLGLGWGLAGVYLVLVNAVAHLVSTVALRGYNPGLWTSISLFLPVGGAALWLVGAAVGVFALHHLVGLGLAVVIHGAIGLHARARLRALGSRAPGSSGDSSRRRA